VRLLFLTNFYPPYEIGGQERSCLQVVEGLKQRGHEALVLTSTHGTNGQMTRSGDVHRSLYLEMDLTPWRHSVQFFTQRKSRERRNLETLASLLEEYRPDALFIWGMWNLPRSLPVLAEELMPGRVVYRFAEYWPTLPSQHEFYWRAPGRRWFSRLLKGALGRVALAMLAREEQTQKLRFEHTICVSAATRDRLVELGVPVAQAEIIHTGLDLDAYPAPELPVSNDRPLRLLYAGRLATDKGVETAILAMAELAFMEKAPDVSLSLAGSGQEDYVNHLRAFAAERGLDSGVTFLGWVPHEEMPALMRRHDVLLVPSIWPEPFARVVLEGMASGLVVVATPAGGTGEIVKDGDNGLLFAPGDHHQLADQINCLAADIELRRKLTKAGWRTIDEEFNSSRMINRYESYFQELIQTVETDGRKTT
jgi:glycosyltransferase involved in cell wall biosynthesis